MWLALPFGDVAWRLPHCYGRLYLSQSGYPNLTVNWIKMISTAQINWLGHLVLNGIHKRLHSSIHPSRLKYFNYNFYLHLHSVCLEERMIQFHFLLQEEHSMSPRSLLMNKFYFVTRLLHHLTHSLRHTGSKILYCQWPTMIYIDHSVHVLQR